MLVSTDEAARRTGLSTYELRTGFKEGRYPALQIGRGDRRKSLRWDVDRLEAAIFESMRMGGQSFESRYR